MTSLPQEMALTSLVDHYETYLPPGEAALACARGIGSLGWDVEVVGGMLVTQAETANDARPTIEVLLSAGEETTHVLVSATASDMRAGQQTLTETIGKVEAAINKAVLAAEDVDVTPTLEPDPDWIRPTGEGLKCNLCGEVFRSEAELDEHLPFAYRAGSGISASWYTAAMIASLAVAAIAHFAF